MLLIRLNWYYLQGTNALQMSWSFEFLKLSSFLFLFPFWSRIIFLLSCVISISRVKLCSETLAVCLQVKVLRSMRKLDIDNVVVGQYKGHTRGGVKYPAYIDDKTVPNNSITPTFAAAALFIDNARWDGVPFLMKAGKALHRRGWGFCEFECLANDQKWPM